MTTNLFTPIKIGATELPNRIFMAPMTRSRATDAGVPLDYVATHYEQRATAGLIITEATNISPMAKGYVRTPGIWNEEQITGWQKVVDAVHAKGGKIFMQIFHTGRIALPDFLPDHAQPVSASDVKATGQNYTDGGMKEFVQPRPLTKEEIAATVADFGNAAANAIKAGFDGVELHGANGYLVHQFLGTNTNLRTDEYGGSKENRARFLLEVVDAMIAAAGAEKVGVKLSPAGGFNDMQETDALELYPYIVAQLNQRNLAYLHIGTFDTSRDWHSILRPLYKGTYLAAVGFDKARGAALLASNGADAIVYGNLFISNPDLVERFKLDAPLSAADQNSFYGGGEAGYIDYPTMQQQQASA